MRFSQQSWEICTDAEKKQKQKSTCMECHHISAQPLEWTVREERPSFPAYKIMLVIASEQILHYFFWLHTSVLPFHTTEASDILPTHPSATPLLLLQVLTAFPTSFCLPAMQMILRVLTGADRSEMSPGYTKRMCRQGKQLKTDRGISPYYYNNAKFLQTISSQRCLFWSMLQHQLSSVQDTRTHHICF